MSDEIEQLDQAGRLMMYLADELPPLQREQLEHELGADAALRQQLEELRQCQAASQRGLSELDGGAHAALPEAVARRRAARVLRQWALRRRAPEPIKLVRRKKLVIPWKPSLAAAAVLLISGLVWKAYHPGISPHIELTQQDKMLLLLSLTDVTDADDSDNYRVLARLPDPADGDFSIESTREARTQ